MNEPKYGVIYLIPILLGETNADRVLPVYNKEIINTINYYIVENERTARRFLSSLNTTLQIRQLTFFTLNEHTKPLEISDFLKPVFEGNNIGIISEAGCPAVADPGAKVVEIAHKHNIRVVPLVGPSSIILALMASGLNGQNFAFNGYLPVKKMERSEKIKFFEKLSSKTSQCQVFIETPYRNIQLFNELLEICNGSTKLCIAANLSTESEYILTKTIAEWKSIIPDINKIPAIFIVQG